MKPVQRFDKYEKLGAYHWKMLEDAPDYRGRVELVASLTRPHMNCLDLGCGDGAYVSRIAPLCRRIFGIDSDGEGVRLGQQMLADHGIANATLMHAAFHEVEGRLPDPALRFDLIYSMDVIEHLYEPADLLDLAERLLAPGGVIVIGTPLFVTPQTVSAYHIKEFLLEELEALLLPRFERIGEGWLDAAFPDVRGYAPRFYAFIGRVRASSAHSPPASEEPAARRVMRQDMLVRCHEQLVRIARLEQSTAETQARIADLEQELSRQAASRGESEQLRLRLQQAEAELAQARSPRHMALSVLRRIPGLRTVVRTYRRTLDRVRAKPAA